MTYLLTYLAELNLLLKCENSQLEQRTLISICKKVLLNAFKVSACKQLKLLTVPKQQLCALMSPLYMLLPTEANATTCRISANGIPIWNHAGVGHISDLYFRTEHRIQKFLEDWRNWIFIWFHPFKKKLLIAILCGQLKKKMGWTLPSNNKEIKNYLISHCLKNRGTKIDITTGIWRRSRE